MTWGIWEAQTGTFDGRNCIIAEQGIEGPYGNGLGRVIVYYAYNENASLELLNFDYI